MAVREDSGRWMNLSENRALPADATPSMEAMPTGSEVAASDRAPKASVEKTVRPPLRSKAVNLPEEKCPHACRVFSVGAAVYREGYSAGIGTGTRLSMGMNSLWLCPV